MFRHKLWKRCFSFKKNDFCILLASVDEHCKNWAEILEWISISGGSGSVFALCLLEVKAQIQNDNFQLSVAISEHTGKRETFLLQKRRALWIVFLLLWPREKSPSEPRSGLGLGSWCHVWQQGSRQAQALCYDSVVHGQWGDCQLTFFGKSSIQVSTLVQWEKCASLSSGNFWSRWMCLELILPLSTTSIAFLLTL